MNVNVKYNGSTITTLTQKGTKTLNTKDTICADNIILETTEAEGVLPVNPTDTSNLNAWIVTG